MVKKFKSSDDVLFVNLRKETLKNNLFRRVLYTDYSNIQLALYSLKRKEALDFESHEKKTQFIYIERGDCMVYLIDKSYRLQTGDAFIIPPSTEHCILNIGDKKLKMFSIYSPPEFEPGHFDITKPN